MLPSFCRLLYAPGPIQSRPGESEGFAVVLELGATKGHQLIHSGNVSSYGDMASRVEAEVQQSLTAVVWMSKIGPGTSWTNHW